MLGAILTWWTRHPWVVWWLMLGLLFWMRMTGPASANLTRFGLGWAVTIPWLACFIQGIRVTARQSGLAAVAIVGVFFLPDFAPFIGSGGVILIEESLGIPYSRHIWPAHLSLFAAVVGGAIVTEVLVRRVRPTRTEPARERLPRWLSTSLRVLALLVLFPLVSAGALVVKTDWARRQTATLCARTAVGDLIAGPEARARALGLSVASLPAGKDPWGRPQPAQIMAWEGWVFARWFCVIDHADGKVLAKRTHFLD